ncbi:hypothetical protein AGLY_014327 [Aphis glycines]|uniref:Uncharacterized protein n=1 Tax=Aphis glycines TaxID=307491 RepID=A0A6G0T3V9_APHGL|nr:hypothetical protein AGLY_014327 [Aphis glycines]
MRNCLIFMFDGFLLPIRLRKIKQTLLSDKTRNTKFRRANAIVMTKSPAFLTYYHSIKTTRTIINTCIPTLAGLPPFKIGAILLLVGGALDDRHGYGGPTDITGMPREDANTCLTTRGCELLVIFMFLIGFGPFRDKDDKDCVLGNGELLEEVITRVETLSYSGINVPRSSFINEDQFLITDVSSKLTSSILPTSFMNSSFTFTFGISISSTNGFIIESVVESTESHGNSNFVSSLLISSDDEHVVGIVVVAVVVVIVVVVVVVVISFVVVIAFIVTSLVTVITGAVFTGTVIVSVFLCLGLRQSETAAFELDNLFSPHIGVNSPSDNLSRRGSIEKVCLFKSDLKLTCARTESGVSKSTQPSAFACCN